MRDLKEHLSSYLDRVERGESIRVTDRGVPKLMLVPLPSTGRLQQGIEEGWITPAKRSGFVPGRRYAGRGLSNDVLAADRDEE